MCTNKLDTKTNNTVANGYSSLQLVTIACHSVLNTNFTPLDPKPIWFDDLNNELVAAKLIANKWIDDFAPEMTASIPTHVLNYGPTYKAMTDEILELIAKDPMAKGKNNPTVQQVFALIEALESSLEKIIDEVLDTENRLKIWGDDMQKAHDNLSTGAANIQKAESDLETHISKMNSAISGLNTKIKAENNAIAYSGIAIGAGLFALVCGIGLAMVTLGAGLVVCGIGAAGIIGGSVSWGVLQAEINAQYDEINEDMKKIADDQRQLVALQGLQNASDMAVSSMETALSTLSDVRTMWATFKGELQGVKDKLEQADEEISMVVNKAYIIAAQSEWDLATEFAQNLVTMKVNIEQKDIELSA